MARTATRCDAATEGKEAKGKYRGFFVASLAPAPIGWREGIGGRTDDKDRGSVVDGLTGGLMPALLALVSPRRPPDRAGSTRQAVQVVHRDDLRPGGETMRGRCHGAPSSSRVQGETSATVSRHRLGATAYSTGQGARRFIARGSTSPLGRPPLGALARHHTVSEGSSVVTK